MKFGFLVTGCLLVGAVSCGVADPDVETVPLSEQEAGIIVGAVNWSEVTSLPSAGPERENSRAVGFVDIPFGGRCTGFLINDDVVMTNQHCIPQAVYAQGVTVSFRFEAGESSDFATYDCSTFLGNNAANDYALLGCQGSPGQTFGSVTLEGSSPPLGHELYVIHQNCDSFSNSGCAPTKKYSPGRVTRNQTDIFYDADTLGGSSGAPVFSATTHGVIGLHHIGIGSSGFGRGSANGAVRMTNVLADIAFRFPSLTFGSSSGNGSASQNPQMQPDSFEPNDTTATATPTGTSFQGSASISSSSDVDRFEVVSSGTTSFSARIDLAQGAGDLDLRLISRSSGTTVATSESQSSVEALTGISLGAGVYDLVVFGYQGATGAYSIQTALQTAAQSNPEPSTASPGATVATAFALSIPDAVTFSIDAADERHIYSFNGTARQIELILEPGAGDLDLYVYNAGGSLVDSSATSANPELVEATVTGGGFIQVVGYEGGTGQYRLTID